MDKPDYFNLEDFKDYLRESIPNECADYICGLISMAKDIEEREKNWRKLNDT